MIPVGQEEIKAYGQLGASQHDAYVDAWWMNFREIPGMTSSNNDTWHWFCLPFQAGSIISSISVKWGATIAGDGFKIIGIKRDDSLLGTAYETFLSEQTFLRPAGVPSVFISELTMSEFVIDANYSYYLICKSIISTSDIYLYSYNIGTKARFL